MLRLGEEENSHARVNVEDEVYLGASLGCTFGAMRSPDSMRPYGGRSAQPGLVAADARPGRARLLHRVCRLNEKSA